MQTNYKFLLLLIFFFYFFLASPKAQTFTKSPVKNSKKTVKEIVEWVKKTGEKEAKKGAVYFFNKKGQLTSFYKNADNWGRKEYDKKHRLTKSYHNENALVSSTTIKYSNNLITEVVDYENVGKEKINKYLNKKGQVIEKKAFMKGLKKNSKSKKTDWILDYRILFTYHKNDSLKTEMHYTYHASDGTGKMKGEKVLHIFDKSKKQKLQSEYYNTSKKLFKTTTYHYNKAKQLIKIVEKKLSNKKTKTKEYTYNKKDLSKIIQTVAPFKYETIYKNGIPITRKSFRYNTPKSIINYQYIYF